MNSLQLFQKMASSKFMLTANVIGIYVVAIMVGIICGIEIGSSVGNNTSINQLQRITSLQQDMLMELQHQTQLLITLEESPNFMEEQHD